jgi:hypothetical protein
MYKIYLDQPGVYLRVEGAYIRAVGYENPGGAAAAEKVAAWLGVPTEAASENSLN